MNIPFLGSVLNFLVSLHAYIALAMVSLSYYCVKYRISEDQLNLFISNCKIPFKWLVLRNYFALHIILGNWEKTPAQIFEDFTVGKTQYTRIIVVIYCVRYCIALRSRASLSGRVQVLCDQST